MRALALGVSALVLTLMAGAARSMAESHASCAQNAAAGNCGAETSGPCAVTAGAEGGRCEDNATSKPAADRPLMAQEESTPPAASERRQNAMPQATRQQKMKTCQFGATDQKLTGAARKTFMSRCLANDDAPPPKASAQGKKQN